MSSQRASEHSHSSWPCFALTDDQTVFVSQAWFGSHKLSCLEATRVKKPPCPSFSSVWAACRFFWILLPLPWLWTKRDMGFAVITTLNFSNTLCFCMLWETFQWFQCCAKSHEDVMSCVNLLRHFAATVRCTVMKNTGQHVFMEVREHVSFQRNFSVQSPSYNWGEFSRSHFFFSVLLTLLWSWILQSYNKTLKLFL